MTRHLTSPAITQNHTIETQLTSLLSKNNINEAYQFLQITEEDEISALINKPNSANATPLMLALEQCRGSDGKHTKLIFKLLEHHADPHQESRSGFFESPLTPYQFIEKMIANNTSNVKQCFSQIHLYLNQSASVLWPSINKKLILTNDLFIHIEKNDIAAIKNLLSPFRALLYGEQITTSINQPNGEGRTPLMYALESELGENTCAIVEILLFNKANPYEFSTGNHFSGSKTPYDHITEQSKNFPSSTHQKILSLFENYSTQRSSMMMAKDSTSKNIDENDPFSESESFSENFSLYQSGSEECLSDQDPSANKLTSSSAKKRLFAAVTERKITKIEKLLKKYPELINQMNHKGESLLMLTITVKQVKHRNYKLVSLLLSYGADINQKSACSSFEDKITPKEYLENKMEEDETDLFYSRCYRLFELNNQDTQFQITKNGSCTTELIVAVNSTRVARVKAFFIGKSPEAAAKLANQADDSGTPLMHALEKNILSHGIIKILRKFGADPHLPSASQNSSSELTPLEYLDDKINECATNGTFGNKQHLEYLKCKDYLLTPSFVVLNKYGYSRLFKILLNKRELRSNEVKEKALIKLFSTLDQEQVKILVNRPCFSGRTPLQVAVENTTISLEIIKLLLANGANPLLASATSKSLKKQPLHQSIGGKDSRKKKILTFFSEAEAEAKIEPQAELLTRTPNLLSNYEKKRTKIKKGSQNKPEASSTKSTKRKQVA